MNLRVKETNPSELMMKINSDPFWLCASECVCVQEREKERKKERKKERERVKDRMKERERECLFVYTKKGR